MSKPLLIIVNGLPGSGKTTLSRQLSADLHLPVFSRDGFYETLYDALDCAHHGTPPTLGRAAFTLLYSTTHTILASHQSLIVEGFFGRPALRSAEFRRLQASTDFAPLQILCKADGEILVKRFLARVGNTERHAGHPDLAWLEENRALLLKGELAPLALDSPLIEIDTTTPSRFDYANLLQQISLEFSRNLAS